MEHIKGNPNSHLTAKDRSSISFPAKILNNKGLIKGDILDFGCGFGKDVDELHKKGYHIEGYDKFHQPAYPSKKYDTILCFYVLNVLLPFEQATVLMEVSRLLKPDGVAYFAVRRDIKKASYRMHKLHNKPTYQCNVNLPFKSVFLNENCQIYAFSLFNTFENSEPVDCLFCNPEKGHEIIAESATAYAIYDKYPVSKGHSLIIPKKHLTQYFHLGFRQQMACWYMVNFVKSVLDEKFNPDAFNVGLNNGEAAGQSISHAHIHIIPRFTGDVKEPLGGVRGVIPEKRKY